MGFSVSGSFALLFLTLFIIAGIVYPAVSNSVERVQEASAEIDALEMNRENTAINITAYSYNSSGNEHVHLIVTNNGMTALHVDRIAILIDNEYQTDTHIVETSVDGNSTTNLWLPGEDVTIITDPSTTSPNTVVVVTEYDVGDREAF